MYSEEMMTYLYSYDMPNKKTKDTKKTKAKQFTTKEKAGSKGDTPLLHVLKSAYATIPVDFINNP